MLMPVLRKDLTKWDRVVPYIAPDPLRPMIDEFNEEVYGKGGFKLFVHQSGEKWFAEVKIGGGGDSEKSMSEIGCMSKAKQLIRSTIDQFTLWHEMCHCLGFEHEQLHAKYPWDKNDNPLPRRYMPADPAALSTDQNKTIALTLDAFYADETALGNAVASIGWGSPATGRANLKPSSVVHFLDALPIASDIRDGRQGLVRSNYVQRKTYAPLTSWRRAARTWIAVENAIMTRS
jgi:hypothetical protein